MSARARLLSALWLPLLLSAAWLASPQSASAYFSCSRVDIESHQGERGARHLYFLVACGRSPAEFRDMVEEGRGEIVSLDPSLATILDGLTPGMKRVDHLYVRGGGSSRPTIVIPFTNGVEAPMWSSNARWTRSMALAARHYWNRLPHEYLRRAAHEIHDAVLMEGSSVVLGVNLPWGFVEVTSLRGALAPPLGYVLFTEGQARSVARALAFDGRERATAPGSFYGVQTFQHELAHYNHYHDEGLVPFAFTGDFGSISRRNARIFGIPIPFQFRERTRDDPRAGYVTDYAFGGELPVLEDYADTLCVAVGASHPQRGEELWTAVYPYTRLFGQPNEYLRRKADFMTAKYSYAGSAGRCQDADRDGMCWWPAWGGDCDDGNPAIGLRPCGR